MTKWDKGVFAGVVVLSALALFVLNVFVYAHTGTQVEIELDGKPYAKYKFAEINSDKSIEIRSDYGYNIINISKNSVEVTKADCPDQLDVRQGPISKAGQSIICLPHRLVIRITGGGGEADATAY